MQQTRQLPAPGMGRQPRSWLTLLTGGAAEVLARLADILLHPTITLPLFFAALSIDYAGIGSAIALVIAAGFVGNALATAFSGDRWRNTRTIALLVALGLQGLSLLLLASRGEALATRPPLTGWPLLLLALAALLGGMAASWRIALVGIVRAEGSWRTRWGRWTMLGAVGTLIGGFLARSGLNATGGTTFPGGFARLFALAGLAIVLGALGIALPLIWTRQRFSLPDLRFSPNLGPLTDLLVNNLAYGRYIAFRLIYACGAIADPFYIIYAAQELNASGHAAAAYLLTLALARVLATLAWRAFSITAGNPMVVQLAAFVRLLAPITALTLPPLLGSATLRDRLPAGEATSIIAFGIVFAAWGAASVGLDLSAAAIQSAITTPRERAAASVITSLVLAATTLILPLGGMIADRAGYAFLFIAALGAGIITLLAGGLLDEPGVIVIRRAPSERAALRRRNVRREG